MKQKVFLALLFTLFFCGNVVCTFAEGPRPTWTIIFYGHGDHNLTDSLVMDVEKIESVGSSETFRIVGQLDFNASSKKDNEEAGLPKELSRGGTRLLFTTSQDEDHVKSRAIERLEEQNSDDPATVEAFVSWAMSKYPADRYAVIFWDHGGQWEGFGGDSQDGTVDDPGELTPAQIRQALVNAMKRHQVEKFDFIAFDTCLMGGIEVLESFYGICDYFIACPEIDYGSGWNYKEAFGWLKEHPNASMRDFAEKEVASWRKLHLIDENDSDLMLAAHAAYDMSQFPKVRDAFVSFCHSLISEVSPDNLLIPKMRRKTVEYGISTSGDDDDDNDDDNDNAEDNADDNAEDNADDNAEDSIDNTDNSNKSDKTDDDNTSDDSTSDDKDSSDSSDSSDDTDGDGDPISYIDLGGFARGFFNSPETPAELKTAAGQLVDAIEKLVVAKAIGVDKYGASGLSIWYPVMPEYGDPDDVDWEKKEMKRQFIQYRKLPLFRHLPWPDYLKKIWTSRTRFNKDTVIRDLTKDDFKLQSGQLLETSIQITEGPGAYLLHGSLIDYSYGKEDEYAYIGEVLLKELNGKGTYPLHWKPGVLAVKLSDEDYIPLCAYPKDPSGILWTATVRYKAPGKTKSETGTMFILLKDRKPRVVALLRADDDLSPTPINVKTGARITPLFDVETRIGDDRNKWKSDLHPAPKSFTISTEGLAGITVDYVSLKEGDYLLELIVEDVDGYYSDVTETDVKIKNAKKK